jgi:hypothetical protein
MSSLSLLHDFYNPLDAVEAVLTTYNLDFIRMDDDELVLSVAGQCASYRLFLTWQNEFGALQVICQFPTEMIPDAHAPLADLLMRANAQLWLGHFECAEDQTLQFRYTTLLPQKSQDDGVDHMNELFKLAVAECDRFYPALKILCDRADVSLATLSFAMQDTAGMG